MQKLMHRARKVSFLEVLQLVSRSCKATDPRDKVFSVLNLVAEDESPLLPDYKTPVAAVYTKVALHVFTTMRYLKLLTHCETGDWPCGNSHLRQNYRQSPRVPDLPSWVPDWNT